MHEQLLTLRMETHTQAAHDALQSRLGELKSALEQQGVQVQQMEVDYRPGLPSPSPQDQAWRGTSTTVSSTKERRSDNIRIPGRILSRKVRAVSRPAAAGRLKSQRTNPGGRESRPGLHGG
jgi:hypothetical protein